MSTLPSSYQFGKVVCQAIRAVGDTKNDPDFLPETMAAEGTIRFEPQTKRKVVAGEGGDYGKIVMHEAVVRKLNADGRLIGEHDEEGVWLITGVYTVSFSLVCGTQSPFQIEIKPEHTDLNPLDLALASPYVPPTGVAVTTILIPSGAAVGDVLAWGAGGVEWAAPGAASVPDATTSTKGKVRLAGDLGGTADAPTVPGLSGKANTSHTHVPADIAGTAVITTDSRLSDARTPTSHTHPAAQISDSTSVGRSVVTAATAAAARTAIGAGTSNFSGAYADLTGKPTIPTDGAYKAVNAQTGTTYTLVAADVGKLVTLSNAAAITLTVPASTLVSGQRVDVLVLGAGMVTVVGASGVTVNATPSAVSRAQYSALTVVALSALVRLQTASR